MARRAGRWCALAAVCVTCAILAGCGGSTSTSVPPPPSGGGDPVAANDAKPTKTLKLTGEGWVNSVGVSPDGKRVFGGLGDSDEQFQLWDVDAPKMIFSKASRQNGLAAMSLLGTIAAYPNGASESRIVLIDAQSGKELRQLTREKFALASYIPAVRFSSRGDILAVNSSKSVVGFNTQSGKEVFACDNKDELFRLSGFFDGDRKIASSGPKGVVKVWDTTTGQLVTTIPDAAPDDIGNLEVSSDGNFLATGCWKHPISIWDTKTWKKVREVREWARLYGSFVFIPNTNLLAVESEDDGVKLVDITTGEVKRSLRGHKSSVIAMAVTPDGTTLVTAGRGDRLVHFWDLSKLP